MRKLVCMMELELKNYGLNQAVRIACDHDYDGPGHVLGYFLGYVTVPCEPAAYSGKPADAPFMTLAAVRYDYGAQGWLNRSDGPSSHITHDLVEPHLLSAAPIYVTVYEVDRAYGGPEEGGWWYDTGTVVQAEEFFDDVLADQEAERLRAEFPYTGQSSSVVYRGGDYRVIVSHDPPKNYPDDRPRYE